MTTRATSFVQGTRQVVAVADLHGHLSALKRLLKSVEAKIGSDYFLVSPNIRSLRRRKAHYPRLGR
ncbi:MAG TPA: hypothetical protein PKO06_15080 [Candidatus Ozemobacteraceae bacterium]|nr:hypothetical protein [Candidatus Ozemobacteraceae bacterium]